VSEPIITTKLNIPRLPARLVTRRRLLNLLDEGKTRKLTLVSAPAGFGKTTLVSAWLQERRLPAAWLSLDLPDNDSVRFVTYVVSALRQIDDSIGVSVLGTLNSPQPLDTQSLVIRLINDIAASHTPITLVLDDWHLIDDVEIIHALKTLVEHQPPHLHLVLITREDPALPLSRLRSRGDLVEVRSGDLRFSVAEVAEFLRQVMGLDLSDQNVAALEARTEGWIAGLYMAALSMRSVADTTAFIEAFTGSHRYILDYLLEEVISRQPADIQAFLLDTSILERMTESLCNAVTQREDGAGMLEQLEAANLFLIPLDDERQWYRYHHLFAELLRARLARLYPERVADIHRQAAAWFEAAGLLVEAVSHAARSGDDAYYARQLERHAVTFIGRGELKLVSRWLDALPDDTIRQSPRLCLDRAWTLFLTNQLLFVTNQFDQIDTWLQSADAILSEPAGDGGEGIRAELLTLRSFLTQEGAERALELAQQAAEIAPVGNVLIQGLIQTALAAGYHELGDIRRAIDASEAAIPLHWEAGNVVAALMATTDIVLLCRAQGPLERAYGLCKRMLARAQEAHLKGSPAVGIVHLGLAAIEIEWGQLEEADRHLQQGSELASAGGYGANDFSSMIKARLERARGNTAAANAVLTDIVHTLKEPSALNPEALTWMAYVLVEQGRLDQAAELIGRLAAVAGQTVSYNQMWGRIVQAYHQVRAGMNSGDSSALRAAQSDLTALASAAEQFGWEGYFIELLALRALASFSLGDAGHAMRDLDQALGLAEQDRRVLLFVSKGKAMADMLTEAIRQGIQRRPFAQKLLDRFPEEAAPRKEYGHPDLVEPLSEREVEVLTRMAEGLTYHDIAERLFISVNTVRYHVKGLYGKLGVSSRADAIARARDLNLI